MKKSLYAIISFILISCSLLTACEDKKKSSEIDSTISESSMSSSQSETDITSETTNKKKKGPVLSISKTEAKAGETVDVTVSLKGADRKWSMCGIHLTYDKRLECVAMENDPTVPEYESGEAIRDMMAFVALIGNDDMPEELTDGGKKGCLFFTTMGNGDSGRDGKIVTFKFKVPEDAKPGDVYELSFYNREGDMFLNSSEDEKFQNQAFSNWESGSVTVK